MAEKFEFLSPADKPALLAFTNPVWLEAANSALQELGYKIHTSATHGDFLSRFGQVRYQVVMFEELFAAENPGANSALQALQAMPMGQRRHATVILLGNSFQTFSPMQAFQQSVHAVINSSELFLLPQLIEKAVADNNLFLRAFYEVQARSYTGATAAT